MVSMLTILFHLAKELEKSHRFLLGDIICIIVIIGEIIVAFVERKDPVKGLSQVKEEIALRGNSSRLHQIVIGNR